MSPDFLRYWPTLLRFEGGATVTEHPADPGGLTKYGISQRAHPTLDIRALTEAEAQALYHRRYWTPAGCDALAWPLNAAVFDTAVHSGVSKAQALLARTTDPGVYLDLRELFLRRLTEEKPTLAVFRRGWLNRLAALRRVLTSVPSVPNV